MFLVGNRSVNMILINECVNGCSLFEDNSHCLLDVSTVTHRAHTQMHAQSLHGAGTQTDMPTGSAREHTLCSQKGHTMAQSHIQEMCTDPAGNMQDTWDTTCRSTHMSPQSQSTCTIHTRCAHSNTSQHTAHAFNKYNINTIHTIPRAHNAYRAPIRSTQHPRKTHITHKMPTGHTHIIHTTYIQCTHNIHACNTHSIHDTPT